MFNRIALFAMGLLFLASCEKEETDPVSTPRTQILVSVSHTVDDLPLVFNQSTYNNAAGNEYSVGRLEYYLSDFAFKLENGNYYRPGNQIQHVDAELPDNHFILSDLRIASIRGISFMIGIPASQNFTGSLEDNLANLNMAWPESLGGGYHFLKLEGHYKDDKGETQGYTVHLGGEGHQAAVEIPIDLFDVSADGKDTLVLEMNVNEWFDNPNLYDFNKQGNYTMAIDSLMALVSENGKETFKAEMK